MKYNATKRSLLLPSHLYCICGEIRGNRQNTTVVKSAYFSSIPCSALGRGVTWLPLKSIHTRTRAHTHVRMHTHAHTHTCTHKCKQNLLSFQPRHRNLQSTWLPLTEYTVVHTVHTHMQTKPTLFSAEAWKSIHTSKTLSVLSNQCVLLQLELFKQNILWSIYICSENHHPEWLSPTHSELKSVFQCVYVTAVY